MGAIASGLVEQTNPAFELKIAALWSTAPLQMPHPFSLAYGKEGHKAVFKDSLTEGLELSSSIRGAIELCIWFDHELAIALHDRHQCPLAVHLTHLDNSLL